MFVSRRYRITHLVQHVLVFQSSMGAKLLLPEQVAAISNQDGTQQSAY